MPYRRTGRPNGRPPRYPAALTIAQLETRAASLHADARRRQAAADARIAAELAKGKSMRDLAAEIGKTVNHVRWAVNRHRKQVQNDD